MNLIDEFMVWYNDAHVLLKIATWVIGILLGWAIVKRLFKLEAFIIILIIIVVFAWHIV